MATWFRVRHTLNYSEIFTLGKKSDWESYVLNITNSLKDIQWEFLVLVCINIAMYGSAVLLFNGFQDFA